MTDPQINKGLEKTQQTELLELILVICTIVQKLKREELHTIYMEKFTMKMPLVYWAEEIEKDMELQLLQKLRDIIIQ